MNGLLHVSAPIRKVNWTCEWIHIYANKLCEVHSFQESLRSCISWWTISLIHIKEKHERPSLSRKVRKYKRKKLGKRKIGVLKRMLIRDPVYLHLLLYYNIMYYFVYHINTIALNWREKPTLSMNENKEIDNSPIKIAQWVGDKAQDGKMC